MDCRPVGVFDSGLGGLTAVMALRQLLPDENIIYFGDTARMPYGTKTVPELRRMAQQDVELVESYGVKAIIAACGTVSSIAPDVLESFPLPVFNVVDAPVRKMAELPGGAPLGIIATQASIKSGVFSKKLSALCPDREIIAVPCQDFVRLIESGHTVAGDALVDECVEKSLAPFKGKGISALLLGCTHFGFLSESISRVLGRETELVSASGCAAACVAEYLRVNSLTGGNGETKYITSGDREQFIVLSSRLLGEDTSAYVVHTQIPEVTV